MKNELIKLISENKGYDFLKKVSSILDEKAEEEYVDFLTNPGDFLNELSNDTLTRYAKKAEIQASVNHGMAGTYDRMADKEDNYDKSQYYASRAEKKRKLGDKRAAGYDMASNKLLGVKDEVKESEEFDLSMFTEEEIAEFAHLAELAESGEQIDEVSKKLLARYINAATADSNINAHRSGINLSLSNTNRDLGNRTKIPSISNSYHNAAKSAEKKSDDFWDKAYKRTSGVKLATGKLTGTAKVPVKNPVGRPKKIAEEYEQIDELSRDKLGSYVLRATERLHGSARRQGEADQKGDSSRGDFYYKKSLNRKRGIERAIKSLVKEDSEQIDELSRDKLSAYIDRAKVDKVSDKAPARETGLKLAILKKWGDKKYGLPEPKVKASTDGRKPLKPGQYRQVDKDTWYSKNHKNVAKAFSSEDEAIRHAQLKESIASDELVLYANNHGGLHRSSYTPIIQNLKKKVKNGTYDHEKAKDLWGYHADRAAQEYHKEFGDPNTKWHQTFSKADRVKAAGDFADQARQEHLKESIEQIDEISRRTLGSYIKKANISHRVNSVLSGEADGRTDVYREIGSKMKIPAISKSYLDKAKEANVDSEKLWSGALKRSRGIDLATDKLTGSAKVPAKNPVGRPKKIAEEHDLAIFNETSIETNLKKHEPRIVYGVKGMNSRPFAKKFRNHDHMSKWLHSEAAEDYTVQHIRRA